MNERKKPWFRWTGRSGVLAAGLLIAAAAAGVGLAEITTSSPAPTVAATSTTSSSTDGTGQTTANGDDEQGSEAGDPISMWPTTATRT